MRILVTGASGFIGRHLVASGMELGNEVVGTMLSPEELENRLPRPPGVEWKRLDLRDGGSVHRVIEDVLPEAVFHLGAQAYVQAALRDPVETFQTNVLGTIHLFEALKKRPPAKGILLASSASAYGTASRLPITEEALLLPTNPYGVSKAAQDMLAYQYSVNFGLRIIRARLFGTTGPGKVGDALNDFAVQVARLERAGEPGQLKVGNLETRRDVSDIRDVLRALWIALERGDPRMPLNIGAGKSYSIREVAAALQRLARVPIQTVIDPALLRPTDEPDNRADISRMKALGYEPKIAIEQTISDALNYWRAESS